MKVAGFKFAQMGSIDMGLKPMTRMPGSPKWRKEAISSGLNVICSPPNLYAFRMSPFSTTRAVSSATWVEAPIAI